jgi:hypothetical protein
MNVIPYSNTYYNNILFDMYMPSCEATRSTFLSTEYAATYTTSAIEAIVQGGVADTENVPFIHNAHGRGTLSSYYFLGGDSGDANSGGSSSEACSMGANGTMVATSTEAVTLLQAVQAAVSAYADSGST